MRFVWLSLVLLGATKVQALELVSPTGNPIFSGTTDDPIYEKFDSLTFKIQGGLAAADYSLEIRGETITWHEKTNFANPPARSAVFAKADRMELVRQLRKARFMDIRGSFRESGLHDATMETLALSYDAKDQEDKVTYRLDNYGGLAPRGYVGLRNYLMELVRHKFPSKGETGGAPKPETLPVFQGLQFFFPATDVGLPAGDEACLSVNINPPRSILPQFYSNFFAKVNQADKGRRDAVLSEVEIDGLVEKINDVPWEEIVGTYRMGGNAFQGGSATKKISFTFAVEGGSRSIEVAGLKNAPSSYNDLEAFLYALIAKHFEEKPRRN